MLYLYACIHYMHVCIHAQLQLQGEVGSAWGGCLSVRVCVCIATSVRLCDSVCDSVGG